MTFNLGNPQADLDLGKTLDNLEKNFFSNMTSLGKFELALASSGKTMSQSGTKVSRRTIN